MSFISWSLIFISCNKRNLINCLFFKIGFRYNYAIWMLVSWLNEGTCILSLWFKSTLSYIQTIFIKINRWRKNLILIFVSCLDKRTCILSLRFMIKFWLICRNFFLILINNSLRIIINNFTILAKIIFRKKFFLS